MSGEVLGYELGRAGVWVGEGRGCEQGMGWGVSRGGAGL